MDQTETDEALLVRFVRGESAALGQLAERYEGALLGLAFGLTGGRAELARDAVQDCWVRVIRYGSGFNSRSSFKTWLYRIVINRCRDLRQEHAKRNGTATHLDLHPKPATPSTSHETPDELAAVLDKLPGPTRLLLLLCYHHGLTHEQAAEVLEIPIGTLKSRLHAALESLRTQLHEERTP